MDLHLLRVFTAIAEEKSLTKAANRLNYVQSNLSARLKQLEEELDCTLFSRTKKGMFLTEYGEKLLPFAQEMFLLEQDIFREVSSTALPTHVTLGVPDSFMRTYLPRPLAEWIKDHPATKIRVKTGYSHQILEYLENHIIDIGVVIARKKPTNIHVIKSIPAELCVVTPRHVKQLRAVDLYGLQPMLLGDSCFFGQALMQLCNDLGLVSERQQYLFSIETILQCVALGFGLSVFPLSLIEQHPLKKEINIHPFPGKKSFSFYKVCLPSRTQSLLVKEFSKYF